MSTAFGQFSGHCRLQSRFNSGDYYHFVEVPRGYLFLTEMIGDLCLLYESSVDVCIYQDPLFTFVLET